MTINPLGLQTVYNFNYKPSNLFAISRDISRKNKSNDILFLGYDVWNCYEFSYLNSKGKPINKVLKIVYSSKSKNIVESKSLKLYLFGFSMTKFDNEEKLLNLIKNDLNKTLDTPHLELFLISGNEINSFNEVNKENLLDEIDVEIEDYCVNKGLLQYEENSEPVEIERYSNLLKTNCPVTGQPDWATIYIKYYSKRVIKDSSLLKYIISYRNHSDYHESCCEKIYSDIYSLINPETLIVKCFFTRRGGIEINPIRYNKEAIDSKNYNFHYWRQ